MESWQRLLPRRRLVPPTLQHRRRPGAPFSFALRQPHPPIGFKIADKRSEDGLYIDLKQGGTLIEYADEDPYIRKHYDDELKKTGAKSAMPAL